MPIPAPPTFHHDNKVIDNFVDYLLKEQPSGIKKDQLILMTGIALNNIELIKYACYLNPDIVNKPVPNHILTIINAVLSADPSIEFKFSDDSEVENETASQTSTTHSPTTLPQ
tara:strand:- start:697 stop:1035 length:339 start_codon:yes stop_codon:yes gene_type:complete